MELPFTLSGRVEHGRALGNTYNMPTANITPREDVSGLARGVYYSRVEVDAGSYPAITNLGVRPTVQSDGQVNAETFIYDYDGDLYGKNISVTLLEFRRPEKKFDSLDELYATVHDDFRAGRAFFGLAGDQ